MSHAELLARVEAFALDGPGTPALPFAARLAREHGWDRGFADRVVGEYKRFAYLAVVAGRPVTPSVQVDAAWHLHLAYTRSYWDRFCRDTLGTPLHHDPTRGGPAEAGKFRRMYAETLTLYRDTFGHEPPADIWPPAGVRFGADSRERVVNTARNWVVPKGPVKRAAAAGLAAVAVLFATGCAGGFNPFDLVGVDYLGFLIPMMLAALAAGRVLGNQLRGPDPRPGDEALDLRWDDAAHLAGGVARLTDAAVARLAAVGAVEADGTRLRPGPGGPPADPAPAEAAVLAALPVSNTPADLGRLRRAVAAGTAADEDRLRADEWMLPPGGVLAAWVTAAAPLAGVLLLLGLPRLVAGLQAGRPVGYLLMALLLGGFLGFPLAFMGMGRTTRRGVALLRRMREAPPDLAAGGADAAGRAVALFGPAVLAGTAYAGLYQWYPRPTSDGGSDSSGSGGGDGGGSGCGGCGGGD